jgi:multimeric flavodoxin WrbA
MLVLGIVCSPRKNGNTEILTKHALTGAAAFGAVTEVWTVSGKDLKPCDACKACILKEGKCHINDDMQGLYPKVLAADGIIFSSPSYFESVSAQGKIVIDRLFCLYYMHRLTNKIAAVISVAGSSGHEGVYAPFRNFIQFNHMFAAEHTYGYGRNKGDIKNDEFAMKSSEELGRQVVSLIKQKLSWPKEFVSPLYRLCQDKYGIRSCPIKCSD